jgi:hypothetical protein
MLLGAAWRCGALRGGAWGYLVALMVLEVLGGAWRCSVRGSCFLVLLGAVWWRLVALGGAWWCCVIGSYCVEVGA